MDASTIALSYSASALAAIIVAVIAHFFGIKKYFYVQKIPIAGIIGVFANIDRLQTSNHFTTIALGAIGGLVALIFWQLTLYVLSNTTLRKVRS